MPLAPTEHEQSLVAQHFAYLQAAYQTGVVRDVGRTTSAPFVGIAIFVASDDNAAQAFLHADPAVRAGVFTGRAQPLSRVMGPTL
jgi:uncharacterized protein YciI